MSKLKELLYSKMETAKLNEEQEKQVMDLLEAGFTVNTDIETCIDKAIEQVLCCINKDTIITNLHEKLHSLANETQHKVFTLELQKMKLKQALIKVINFEWNAWTEAKKLLETLEGEENGTSIPVTKEPSDSVK